MPKYAVPENFVHSQLFKQQFMYILLTNSYQVVKNHHRYFHNSVYSKLTFSEFISSLHVTMMTYSLIMISQLYGCHTYNSIG